MLQQLQQIKTTVEVLAQDNIGNSPPFPPPPGRNLIKVNFDVTTFANSRSIGVGVMVRNAERSFLASLCKKLKVWLTQSRL